MKNKTSSRYSLSFTLWQWDLRLPGILLFFLSSLLFGFYSLQYQINCEERIGLSLERCTLIKRLPPFLKMSVPLGTLKHAYVRSYPSYDHVIGVFHNIMLESDDEITPVLRLPTPGQFQKERVAQLIQHFIKYSHKLNYRIPSIQSRWIYYIILLLMVFGLFMIIRINVIYVVVDKKRNIIRIDWQNILHVSHRTMDINLLKTIDVESTITKKGKRRYRLALILKDGEVIPFTKRYSYFFFTKRNIAIQLNRFLGIINIISKGQSLGTDTSRLIKLIMFSMVLVASLVLLFTL